MSKTLEELEDDYWGEAEYDSYLVQTCHALRHKPIDQFSVEDLRIMIGQNIGLVHLLPPAMDVIRGNPFASGDFYDGDLLQSVLRCELVQSGESELTSDLKAICARFVETLDSQAYENLFGDDAPEKYGLSDISATALRQEEVKKLAGESPFSDCLLFLKTHGN
ncbi:contact-dependent growth inhibition system immunity protein [Hoeflea poritis]|uniref:Contact-dependent growth inhibition system immunity protein n=1 Tax=Hoeflea poritis TaxID=2993659 RepID=A0ABT4VS30_9HYPH|nr:contact-dependent growth inhibition system immunity protein [Hoeflea poritis]MDA4847005.1 contact-dependent growth inhibition system immunity protein [Hoeflea poritis]